MDTLRGNFADRAGLDEAEAYESAEEEASRDTPPPNIGQDERRMQVRAYNHWASLLEDRNFPSIDDLEADNLPDFGPYSVLLDFTAGLEDPGISYLGGELAEECGADEEISRLSDIPSRSLLSRITDHYMQILANQAPIGFEAEFVNQRGVTILYRGILLPFSSDDDTIDFIYGVINWKELADQKTTDELMLEIDQALEEVEEDFPEQRELDAPMSDWADGPAANDTYELSDEVVADLAPATDDWAADETPIPAPSFGVAEPVSDDWDADETAIPVPSFGTAEVEIELEAEMELGEELELREEAGFEDEDEEYDDEILELEDIEETHEGEDAEEELSPAYASLSSIMPQAYQAPETDAWDEDEDEAEGEALLPEAPLEADAWEAEEEAPSAADGWEAEEAYTEIELAEIDESEMELGDWLASARELAMAARTSEDRTRNALYDAISRAYDFSLAAYAAPEEFAEIVADSGLTMQDRAPMTPVVKLVFGADYDKTRLTEYASALTHAHRFGLDRGELGTYLREAEGGLKAVVAAERRLRREEAGQPVEAVGELRERLAKKLRRLSPVELDALPAEGKEFGLVMIRRLESGEIVLLGEVPDDLSLVERAARKLLG
jgi:hypothetical protein